MDDLLERWRERAQGSYHAHAWADAVAELERVLHVDRTPQDVRSLKLEGVSAEDWAVQTAIEAEGETDPGYLAHSFAIKFGLREKLTYEQAMRLEAALAEFLWAAR